MRKVVAGLFVSLDGVTEAPETWTGPYFSPEIGQESGTIMAQGGHHAPRADCQTFETGVVNLVYRPATS